MDFHVWRRYFLGNKRRRPEPRFDAPVDLAPATRAILATSLAHFQLGESGDGGTLLRGARFHSPGPGFEEAAALFVAEEQEHARLLAGLVQRFGGELVSTHWTHTTFKALRHLAGLDFEMQVLLVAETLGTAYYRLLSRRCTDPAIADACVLILRDEEAHLRFHADNVRARARGTFRAALFRLRLGTILRAASLAAWLDHGSALRAFGWTWTDFRNQSHVELARFHVRVASPAVAPPEEDAAAA